MLPNFSYVRPKTLKDAVKQLSSEGSGVLAGGTDLLGCLHDRVLAVKKMVSISDLADLRGIRKTADNGLTIGALTTITEVAENKLIQEAYPGLAQAAAEVASSAAPKPGHDRRKPLPEAKVLVLPGGVSLPPEGRKALLRGLRREPVSLHLRRRTLLHRTSFGHCAGPRGLRRISEDHGTEGGKDDTDREISRAAQHRCTARDGPFARRARNRD